MDHRVVKLKPTSGKLVFWSTCLMLCGSVLFTRTVSSVKRSVPVTEATLYKKIAAGEKGLYRQAYISWHHDHQFEKSRDLYRKLFATGTAKPSMHLSYADMLVENREKEEALLEYRLGFADESGVPLADPSHPLVMARYATLCRKGRQNEEADWAERQVILAAGERYPGYPRVSPDQLSRIPVHAMAEIARGLELQKRGENTQAFHLFQTVARENPDLVLAKKCLQQSQYLKKYSEPL